MKKLTSLLFGWVLTLCLFSSCSFFDSEENKPIIDPIDFPTYIGVAVLNEGSFYNNIFGTIDYFDRMSIHHNLFENTNGRQLGGTPNDAIYVKGRLYIACTDEDRIEIIDPSNNFKSLGHIDINQPRCFATDGTYVYVSSYNGCVSKIFEESLVGTTTTVGACLEGITYLNGKLYVCNAYNPDYTYNNNLVVIDAEKMQKTGDINVSTNPCEITNDGENLYVQCSGNYYDIGSSIQMIDKQGKATTIGEGTYIAWHSKSKRLYYIDAPYGGTPSFKFYDPATKRTGTFATADQIPFPYAIACSKYTAEVFITALPQSTDYPGYADYLGKGKLHRFYVPYKDYAYLDPCVLQDSYEVGVNPGTICFIDEEKLRE